MSTVQRFRKKPVVIEAMQYDGTTTTGTPIIDWALAGGVTIRFWCGDGEACRKDTHALHVQTLEGVMTADVGDWVIKGVQGEFYPCKPDIFAATYERAS